jgi:hypothetical protein
MKIKDANLFNTVGFCILHDGESFQGSTFCLFVMPYGTARVC